MAEPDLVNALLTLGFSLNESRAYTALLQESPATGYEVGVRASVPRSAVYGVLRRLVKVGAARSIAGTPERFAPVPAEELLRLLRKRFDTSCAELEEAMRTLDKPPETPEAFTVRGYARVLEEAERLVRSAEERLLVSGWPREVSLLALELKKAARRRVYVVVFSHAAVGPFGAPIEVFSYGLPEEELEAFWKHRLVVVADDRRTLIGATERPPDARDPSDGADGADHAVVSETAAIAEITTSQVALDITLLSQRTGRDVGEVMAKMLGPRVGRLDSLLKRPARPSRPRDVGLGAAAGPGEGRARKKAR
jgi:sugar-specific transcriptional regulator TrmB